MKLLAPAWPEWVKLAPHRLEAGTFLLCLVCSRLLHAAFADLAARKPAFHREVHRGGRRERVGDGGPDRRSFFLTLTIAPPTLAPPNFCGVTLSDWIWPAVGRAATGVGVSSKAPMSGAAPRMRGLPSKSVGPSWSATPASIVGEPAASRKSPPAALAKRGRAVWLAPRSTTFEVPSDDARSKFELDTRISLGPSRPARASRSTFSPWAIEFLRSREWTPYEGPGSVASRSDRIGTVGDRGHVAGHTRRSGSSPGSRAPWRLPRRRRRRCRARRSPVPDSAPWHHCR